MANTGTLQQSAPRKLPVGIQDFETIRTEGYSYADKTALIYELVQNGKLYFLSRPRRFGKSLLISTLEAYFLGKKELFSGLAIAEKETEWATYPVLHFDFNGQDYTVPNGLNEIIDAHLRKWEKIYRCPKESNSPGIRLADIIEAARAQTGHKVVVLVDEYDKALLETMTLDSTQTEANSAIFKGMFGQLKRLDGSLRFVLFSGVTKFSKVSIFSDLNQLEDISLDEDFSTICGITQKELEQDFAPETDAMATSHAMTREECLARLKRLYDGYHFCSNAPAVYNPFSLINALKKRTFGRYWFGTGIPSFLVKRLNDIGFNPKQFSDNSISISRDEISDYRPDNPNIVPLLYQSGYLTIKDYDNEFDSYLLGYPNDEVKYGFTASLAPVYLRSETPLDVRSFGRDIKSGNTDSLKERFIALFAHLPYASTPADKEKLLERDFQNVIYLTFLLLGQFVRVEQHSAKGRADCIVETDNFIYIFEFKRDSTADEALSQIDTLGYAKPFAADSRTLIKVGASFSSAERNLTEWKTRI